MALSQGVVIDVIASSIASNTNQRAVVSKLVLIIVGKIHGGSCHNALYLDLQEKHYTFSASPKSQAYLLIIFRS